MGLTGQDETKVLRIPGRLVWAPTDLSGSFPYGGTALGITGDVPMMHREAPRFEARDPYSGGSRRTIYTDLRVRFVAVLSEWSDAVIERVFPSAATGGTSAEKYVLENLGTTTRPGLQLTTGILLWVSNNEANHPSILLRSACCVQKGLMEVAQSPLEEQGFAVEFVAQWDGSDQLYAQGKIEDLSV